MNTLYRKTIFVLFLQIGFVSSFAQNKITQVSTIDALKAGLYDGIISFDELLLNGNTGIGTFDKLDGEMVLLDGTVYRVSSDGKVVEVPVYEKTPFSTVVDFKADTSIAINKKVNVDEFKNSLDKLYPNQNLFYVIKAHGKFQYIKTRSVAGQSKPYPKLMEVIKNQSIFEMENISGTIVGFRCPPFVEGINVTGYHFHFISDDFSAGGHILDFKLLNANVEIDICSRFTMILPEKNEAFRDIDFSIENSMGIE